jgi:hypothetical protein
MKYNFNSLLSATEISIFHTECSTLYKNIFIQGRVTPLFFNHEKMIFREGDTSMFPYYLLEFDLEEIDFLFFAPHGTISPDGKYFAHNSSYKWGNNPIEDEKDGFYIKNIETGKTAFIPIPLQEGYEGTIDMSVTYWVSVSGINDLIALWEE